MLIIVQKVAILAIWQNTATNIVAHTLIHMVNDFIHYNEIGCNILHMGGYRNKY